MQTLKIKQKKFFFVKCFRADILQFSDATVKIFTQIAFR